MARRYRSTHGGCVLLRGLGSSLRSPSNTAIRTWVGRAIGVRNAASNRAGVVTERRDAPHNQHNTTLYQVSPTVGTNTPGRRAALRLDSRSLPETAIGHGGACGLTAEGEHWGVQAMRLAFARGIPLMASTKCSDVHVTFEPR